MYSAAPCARVGSGLCLPVRSEESGGSDFRYSAIACRSASVKWLRLFCTTSAIGPKAVVLPLIEPVLRYVASSSTDHPPRPGAMADVGPGPNHPSITAPLK